MDISKIDQISGIGKINGAKPKKSQEKQGYSGEDTLSISSEGLKASEIESLKRLVNSIPEVRQEKIDVAITRMKDGYYLNPSLATDIAETILRRIF
ncbi:TPA: hypothetical protein DCX16_07025 [bacterium]|nr:hypothetical protein [bacterium]